MTAVNVETGEVLEVMTSVEAERITHRIVLKLGTLADTYEAVMPMIRAAIVRQAHQALGYPSPGAYISDRFGDSLSRLDSGIRREVVRELSDAGLSTRAIAPVVGVSQGTVRNDLKPGEQSYSPEPHPQRQPIPAVLAQGPALPNSQVQGLDGKTYSRPVEPPQPKRRPLGDGFRDASLDLAKVITRFDNLVDDDRLAKNKNEVARYANDLIRARDALQRVIEKLSN